MAKRRSDDDDGFEVVDDDPRPRRSSRHRDDAPRSSRSSRLSRQTDADDEGFEVVEDEPPLKAKRWRIEVEDEDDRPHSKSKSRHRDEDDDEDDRPRSKSRSSRRDEDERPRSKSRSSRRDEEEDERSSKRKSRLTKKDRARLLREEREARDGDQANAIMEWGPPIFITFLGAVLMIASGVILANRTEGLINPAYLIGIAFVFTLVLVPVTILALMVIGGLMGIEYGTITNAVRSLIAISTLSWGIFFFSHLFFIGWVFGPLVSFIVTFGLFMVFFNLDPQEAMSTLGALNILMWLADKLFWFVVIVAVSRGFDRDRGFDPDDGPRIGNKADDFDDDPNNFDPDEDF